uniref:Ig-like domain-containing protein n=1 Tax=Oryzias latipes TaxID=8090 RepID=A0A3P9LIA6_ORYLA
MKKLKIDVCFVFIILVCSPSAVQAHLGQNVVLSCRVEPPINLTAETLEWKHGPAVVHVYRSGGDNNDDQDLRFKNRTILNHQNLKDGNVSLTLTNVTKEDEGNYTFCLPKQVMCSNVTLTVGKKPAKSKVHQNVLMLFMFFFVKAAVTKEK